MAVERLPTTYGLVESDPEQLLIDRRGISPSDLAQIERIMAEMGRMRQVERKIMRSSQRYMQLNETDMRALRQLIAAKNVGRVTTPTDLRAYLGISSASVTKMIDRLEANGHVRRSQHPTDRRSQCIEVTEQAHLAAREQMGRHHAKRFEVAYSLTPEEREVVIRFLAETSDALDSSLEQSNPTRS
ncbi:MarR family winged helix-turn-helix transcriptional regulator [Glutamicibacter sp. M10]|uniref:MarR family winged helix-turn-helix transcriptional regulator n=1 Tax=Glutamicibacter sp. M10 TaxID=3023076 RepID=UPI0021C8CC75|nr:MarR family transcriptional regulator [Glutamicibacter sp. M10]UXN31327.1 MarR family transcriptional regulator [Glutamicibacter sp. M10]